MPFTSSLRLPLSDLTRAARAYRNLGREKRRGNEERGQMLAILVGGGDIKPTFGFRKAQI
jgi:hypothetical protein